MGADMSLAIRAFLCATCLSMTIAQILTAAEADQPWRQVVILRPAREQGPPIEFDYRFANAPVPFENEPPLEGKEIARGLIPTVPPTPLIRNITDRELYLKVDHGRDFTTGPLVTYKSQSRDGVHIEFAGLRVFTERESLAIPYTVHVRTYRTGYSGRLFVQSGWSGQFERDGKSWRIAIVDNLDGEIDGEDRLHLIDGDRDSATVYHDCPVPRVVFLDGHAYDLDIRFQSVESEVVLEAAWTEVRPSMGELAIEADGCANLALRDERQILLLNHPEGTVSVPVGNYRVDQCVLPHKGASLEFAGCDRMVSVRSGEIAALRLGLPLSNTIVATRDRNLLSFKYHLIGAGGELYEYDNPASRPAFRIYRGPLRIGQGSFGFG
jgi:hypothetical protein